MSHARPQGDPSLPPLPESCPPLVSVICPSLNSGDFILDTIESVLSQNYEHIELIVIDGGSDDNTPDILESLGDEIIWVSSADAGQADAINKGMAQARGDILAWLNADDLYVPGAVQAVVDAFVAEPDLGLVYGDALAIDRDARSYGRRMNVAAGTANDLVRDRCFIVQPAAFWRREVWAHVGPLRTDLHFALDYEFFMRVTAATRYTYLPRLLAHERIHAEAKTFNGSVARIEELRQAALDNGGTDLPRAFQAEGAAVFLVDAGRRLLARDGTGARRQARQAVRWVHAPLRFIGYLLATAVGGPRGLAYGRLQGNRLRATLRS